MAICAGPSPIHHLLPNQQSPDCMYVLDEHKGVLFAPSKAQLPQIIHLAGLDLLPWDSVLDEIEPLQDQPETDRKPTRKEKKEQRKRRAANALHHVSSKLGGGLDEPNPYVAKQRLMRLHQEMARSGKDDVKLFQFGLVAVYRLDVDHLVPEEWLNDNNISLVYEVLHTYFLKDTRFGNHVYLMFPALVQLLVHFPAEDDLHSMLPMKELAQLKLVFLPFNFIDDDDYVDLEDANNGDHWALCVLSVPEKRLYLYDSMAFDGEDDEKLLRKLALRVQKALFKPGDKLQILKMKCCQQSNFDDCGVFLVMFSCYLIGRLLSGEPTDLSVATVQFNPHEGRLQMMELVYKLYCAAKKLSELASD